MIAKGQVWVGMVGLGLLAASTGLAAEPTPGGEGLAAFVPQDALVFVERRGHAAVREAMLTSNFAPIASDEAIVKFVADSRVRAGKQIVKDLFDLKEPEDVEARRKQLHEVVEALWRQPAAFCLLRDKGQSSYGAVVLCATGRYRTSCRKGLEELMKIDVPPEGVAGTKQALVYRKGEVLWTGLARHAAPFVLPKASDERAEALREGSVFLACWVDDLLVIVTSLQAADAMSGMLSVTAPGASLVGEKAFQSVAARTHIADWAFRWHVAVKAAFDGPSGDDEEPAGRAMPEELKALGLDRVVALGGSEGYLDKVVTRRTLVYAPSADLSTRLIRSGGSYHQGLAMTPRGAALSLAGEIDVNVLARLMAPPPVPRPGGPAEVPASQPAGAPPGRSDDPTTAALARLILAGDGNAALYMMDLPGGFGGGEGFPVGAVMGVKHPARAQQAIDALAEMLPAGKGPADEPDESDPASQPASRPASAPAKPELYRAIPIRRAGLAEIALLKDRVVVGFSPGALKAGLDAALDNSGGLPADGKTRALADLAGPGALLARIDMSAMVKILWPLLRDQGHGSDFPLASLPTTEKMISLLGSEVAVVESLDEGILLKSRGHVPLLTKAPLGMYPGFLFLFLLH